MKGYSEHCKPQSDVKEVIWECFPHFPLKRSRIYTSRALGRHIVQHTMRQQPCLWSSLHGCVSGIQGSGAAGPRTQTARTRKQAKALSVQSACTLLLEACLKPSPGDCSLYTQFLQAGHFLPQFRMNYKKISRGSNERPSWRAAWKSRSRHGSRCLPGPCSVKEMKLPRV